MADSGPPPSYAACVYENEAYTVNDSSQLQTTDKDIDGPPSYVARVYVNGAYTVDDSTQLRTTDKDIDGPPSYATCVYANDACTVDGSTQLQTTDKDIDRLPSYDSYIRNKKSIREEKIEVDMEIGMKIGRGNRSRPALAEISWIEKEERKEKAGYPDETKNEKRVKIKAVSPPSALATSKDNSEGVKLSGRSGDKKREFRCIIAILILTSLGIAGIVYQDVGVNISYILLRHLVSFLALLLPLSIQTNKDCVDCCLLAWIFWNGLSWMALFFGMLMEMIVFKCVVVGLDTLILVTEVILDCFFCLNGKTC